MITHGMQMADEFIEPLTAFIKCCGGGHLCQEVGAVDGGLV